MTVGHLSPVGEVANPRLMVVCSAPDYGGAQTFVVRLLVELQRRGDLDLSLVTLRAGKSPRMREMMDALPIPVEHLSRRRAMSAIGALARLIRRDRPEIVLSMIPNVDRWVTLLKCLFPSILFVVRKSELEPVLAPIIGRALFPQNWLADVVVATSEDMRRRLLRGGVSSGKIVVIPNMIDGSDIRKQGSSRPDHPWYRQDLKVVVSVGRIEKVKGHELLVRAFSKVVKAEPEARLVIVGDGRERSRVEDVASEVLAGNSMVLGWQACPACFVAGAQLLVLPSYSEGFPNAVLEALALGVPVVSTDCGGGVRDLVIPGKTGHLVGVGDEDPLAEAILSILRSPPLRAEMSNCAREHAEKFESWRIAGEYARLFHNLGTRTKPSGGSPSRPYAMGEGVGGGPSGELDTHRWIRLGCTDDALPQPGSV